MVCSRLTAVAAAFLTIAATAQYKPNQPATGPAQPGAAKPRPSDRNAAPPKSEIETRIDAALDALETGLIAEEHEASRPASPFEKPPTAPEAPGKAAKAKAQPKASPAFQKALSELHQLFDFAIATTPTHDAARLAAAARAVRTVNQLSRAEEAQRLELLRYLRAHPQLAETLAFAVHDKDLWPGVFKVLDQLRERSGDKLDDFANLAVATCVVHDEPLVQYVNENRPEAKDPVAIFEYFVRNEKRLLFPVRDMPPTLLVWVVDCTAPVDDMEWALARYKNQPNVGQRFDEITYDTDHLRDGKAKKSTAAGWGIRNIQKLGGICADQAYYAMTTGKAQGVPTAYVRGKDDVMSHAWVGYLRQQGKQVSWDFTSGRFGNYRDVRGTVRDPQTQEDIPDAFVAVSADFMTLPRQARLESMAFADAARRVAALRLPPKGKALPPVFPPKIDGLDAGGPGNIPATRELSNQTEIELIETSLRRAPSNVRAWLTLSDAAGAGKLSYQDKVRWGEVLENLCGHSYPDFMIEILKPMIASEPDPAQKDALYNAAFAGFSRRPDLASEIRLLQGRAWEEAKSPAKAWDSYNDVLNRFANDGPYVVEASARIEELLRENGKQKEIVPTYKGLWQRLERPSKTRPEAFRQCNWFRVGVYYALALDEAGKASERDAVLRTLELKELPTRR